MMQRCGRSEEPSGHKKEMLSMLKLKYNQCGDYLRLTDYEAQTEPSRFIVPSEEKQFELAELASAESTGQVPSAFSWPERITDFFLHFGENTPVLKQAIVTDYFKATVRR